MQLHRRVAGLEAKQAVPCGKVHRIIQNLGQTRDEALDEYGRDKIGPDDFVIVRHFVTPVCASEVEGVVQ